MTVPNYLGGTPDTYDSEWRKISNQPTRGDVLEEQHREDNPDVVPFLERNGPRLIGLCMVGLGVLGLAAWGMPAVFEGINSYVDYSVD